MAGYKRKANHGAQTFEHPKWALKKAEEHGIENPEKLTFEELKAQITDRIKIKGQKANDSTKTETGSTTPAKEAKEEVAKITGLESAAARAGGVYINVAAPIAAEPVSAPVQYVKADARSTALDIAREVVWWCQAAIVGAAMWSLFGKPVGAVLAQASMTAGGL